LHPIDLEREGLVGALHQRLAAVEGRSDIKARMLTDENLSLSLDVEVALYFIAQEALNNVLKHAHAKSVNIRIRKRKNDLVLEVEDDGRGFNPQQENLGGIGLRNMKERILMVGGKLRIDSHPGEGTKITVTVPKEKRSKAH
jgi:signal transduction histidine kinase